MRRGRKEPPKPFAQAFDAIDRLERNVVAAKVKPDFTVQDVLRMLYPDDVVDKLQAAYPLTRYQDQGSYMVESIPWEGAPRLTIYGKAAKMLIPERNLSVFNQVRGEPLLQALTAVLREHRQFDRVRYVVRWLNEHATAGAARHYCPWLTAILPSSHPIHQSSGSQYKEPTQGTGEVMDAMRDSAGIIAMALLCPEDTTPRHGLSVAFSGPRQPVHREAPLYASQDFGLLPSSA
jgi:hypothetical protein